MRPSPYSIAPSGSYNPPGQTFIAGREGINKPPFAPTSMGDDKKKSEEHMSYKDKKKAKGKMEKCAALLDLTWEKVAMHPAMKKKQEEMKDKMDDKDGDGEPEPDKEELSKEERVERLKKLKDKKKG